MFLTDHDISPKLFSVLDLTWDKVDSFVQGRPYHALCVRVEGGASLSWEKGEVFSQEGEITFTPAGLDFRKKAGPSRILVVHFTTSEPLPQEILRFKPANSDFFLSEFWALHQVWTKKEKGYALEAAMRFYRILYELEKEWERLSSHADSKLSIAYRYIHDHFCNHDLTVEQLTKLCAVSDTYFRRLFLQEFGMTPLQYINELRLTKALELLRTSYYSVSQIAEQCGFNNINYFSYFIKKETGRSPLTCRRRLMEGKTPEELKKKN